MGEREAVDRAVGVRRHIHLGYDIARENAPGRFRERDALFLHDRHGPRLDQRQGRVDIEQRAAKGKAIVAQLRHGSTSR